MISYATHHPITKTSTIQTSRIFLWYWPTAMVSTQKLIAIAVFSSRPKIDNVANHVSIHQGHGINSQSNKSWATYRIIGNGDIANIITPTAQNAKNIEKDVKVIAGNLAGKPEDDVKKAIEIMVRAYDPCISCSVHMVQLK